MTRNGKIARLPRKTREELNRRLEEGEAGRKLVEWLNSLPEVGESLARQFGGRLINEQNLSEWKTEGYRDWQARQEALAQARELAEDAGELAGVTYGRLTDHLATVLASRCASALASWHGNLTFEYREKLRALRGLCQDIVELRRGDHSSARLKLEHERMEREREKTESEVLEHFKKWAENPQVCDWICKKWVSPEERERRIHEIFGLLPKQTGTAEPKNVGSESGNDAQTESN